MKQIFTRSQCSKFSLLLAFSLALVINSQAQTYPTLSFTNGVLSSGTDKQAGATYKFTNVTTGVNATVKIDSLVGGALIATLDSVGTGYNEAFQPIVTSQPGNASYAVITISFFDQKNNPKPYFFTNLAATAIDVDGDNGSTKEYVGINMRGGIPSATVLTSTSTVALTTVIGAGFRGDNTDAKTLPGIDTTNYNGMFKVRNTNVNSITFRFGATIPATGKAETRFHSVYFKDFAVQSSSTSSGNQRVITTLPVKFASFTATRNNKNTELKWQTATEINNKGFYVQKKTGGEWKDIAFVFSKTTNGNSNTLLSYSYTDPAQLSGMVQYRIAQVDFNGKTMYSEVRTLENKEQNKGLTLYPNPSTNGTVNIVIDDYMNSEVTISDMLGKVVKLYTAINGRVLLVQNLKDGFYTIRTYNRQTSETRHGKIIVSK